MSPPSPPPSTPNFSTPPPPLPTGHTLLSFPTPQILLVTLNRPDQLNCINAAQHAELDSVWAWLDAEPRLRCGIITGRGRAFCAGADLKEWNSSPSSSPSSPSKTKSPSPRTPPTGFGGLSRRLRKKPILAAVNGICFGGGFEMVINCDIILAASSAMFALPEVKVGVVALAGALPRLGRVVGRQRAMEMVVTGRGVNAREGREWGFVNEVVDDGVVVKRAVEVAETICGNSPDGVLVSKSGVEMGWAGLGVEEATEKVLREGWARMEGGENMKEGLKAFVEKRKPRWRDSKL